MPIVRRRHALLAAALIGACAPAWSLFKVIGPDGTVTYTDRPPAASVGKIVQMQRAGTEAPPEAVLPYALRQVVERYPVTLFTTADCGPCDRGRELLRKRGVPFRERIASTDADREAWQRIVKSPNAPVLTIGSQVLQGLQADTWNNYLDVAGYPQQSQLPPSYSPPSAEPLAGTASAAEPGASAPQPAATTRRPAPAEPPAGAEPPGGIRF
ncbi:MAG TPA: glutaredoxin family protein [Burkholderiaceae bacterium]|nr:glutaredoxin family protein [Burkholderiaceae bacterium]